MSEADLSALRDALLQTPSDVVSAPDIPMAVVLQEAHDLLTLVRDEGVWEKLASVGVAASEREVLAQAIGAARMGADYCGAVFTNSSGCTATYAAAGLVCAVTYENVENQCARDESRPTLPCDSGHQSDYCVCRRM